MTSRLQRSVIKNLLLLAQLSAFAGGQTPKYEFADKPLKDGPFVHMKAEPVRLFVHSGTVSALGVWVAVGKSSPPSGPSVSQITCYRQDGTCHEQIASIL